MTRQQAGVSAELLDKLAASLRDYMKLASDYEAVQFGIYGQAKNALEEYGKLETAALATAPPEQAAQPKLHGTFTIVDVPDQPQPASDGALDERIWTDLIKCGCDEYPECTHVLYWYEGFKVGTLHPKAASTTSPSAEPWLFAIAEPSGAWHDGEQCVFGDRESAQSEVDMLNDDLPEGEAQYKLVPLFRTLAAHDQKVRAETLEEAVQAIIAADMIVEADEPRAIEAIRSLASGAEEKEK